MYACVCVRVCVFVCVCLCAWLLMWYPIRVSTDRQQSSVGAVDVEVEEFEEDDFLRSRDEEESTDLRRSIGNELKNAGCIPHLDAF